MWLEIAWANNKLPLFSPARMLSLSVERQLLSSLGGSPIMNVSVMFVAAAFETSI